ncbi:MAG: phosphatidylinositol alpha-1,6-mannosyltransferase [Gammaproteobacteria bacterium]|jgi:phosphatidylinositol alpha-1,6-mannosyltransferase
MVIISTQCFAPTAGGIESVMHELASNISSSGKKVVVFADQTKSPQQQLFDSRQPFTTHRYSGIRLLRRQKKARDIHKYVSNLDAYNQKILLVDSWKSIEFIDASLFSKIVCLAHGSETPLTTTRSKCDRIKRAYSNATSIIANSQFTATRAKPYLENHNKISVIHPGISLPLVDQRHQKSVKLQLNKHSFILTTVARLEPRKNHQIIIRSLPELLKHHPNILYIVIGEGQERRTIEALSVKLNVKSHVLFTGTLSGSEKNAYLANSSLFVMPGTVVKNNVEGFGLAYIEAGFFGIPSIATNTGGASEAVLHNKTGVICDVDNQTQLEKSILDLLEDKEKRHLLGRQAQLRSTEFLWQNKIQEYFNILE